MNKKKTFTFSNYLTIKNNPNLQIDSDMDGLDDINELKWGTDPFEADTDGDGMNDGDEIKNGRNPLGAGMLKDLLIPHSGNDYKPQLLQPGRLAFHAAGAIIVKTMIIGFLVIFPIEAWLMPDALFEEGKKIISLTNKIRVDLRLEPLKENSKLDKAAYEKTQDMLFRQYFSHISPENKSLSDWLKNSNYDYSVAGENLAMGFSNVEDVIEKWKESPTHYSNIIDPDFSEIGVGVAAGNYKNIETVFITQLFGKELKNDEPRNIISGQIKYDAGRSADQLSRTEKNTGKKTLAQNLIEKLKKMISPKAADVSSEKQYAEKIIKDSRPAFDISKTSLLVSEPVGQNKIIVEAAADLSPDITKAQIKFDDHTVDMQRDEQKPQNWFGNLIIFKQGNVNTESSIMIPATIQVWDKNGLTKISDIGKSDIVPVKSSIARQYDLLKEHQSNGINSLFAISSIYYYILFILAAISLLLNIFIEIKKQHPKIIFSTVGFICLMAILIII